MRQKDIQSMKGILRIALCSIGGVFTIFGIMFGLYCFVQLPDGVSIYVPYAVLSVFMLPIGLYLCFVVIKQTRYFVKSRKTCCKA